MPIRNSDKRFGWLIFGLTISCFLNTFLIGFLLGNFGRPIPSTSPGPISISRFMQQLPAADQHLIQAAFKSRLSVFQNLRQELRQLSKQVASLMQETSLDPASLKVLLQKIRFLNEQIQANFHQMILELFPNLSVEGRKKLAESQRWDLSSILQRR